MKNEVIAYILKVHPLFLVALGGVLGIDLLTLYSVAPYLAMKQGIWEIVGLFVSAGILMIPYTLLVRNARIIYGIVLTLLFVVVLFGHQSHGARRWIGSAGSRSSRPNS